MISLAVHVYCNLANQEPDLPHIAAMDFLSKIKNILVVMETLVTQ